MGVQTKSGPQLKCVVAEERLNGRATVRGYVLYAIKPPQRDRLDNVTGTLSVTEMFAVDVAAYRALWDHLLGIDFYTEVEATLPADDPVQFLLADPRRLRAINSDAIWVRLVDVGEAMASRAYAAPVELVLEVQDEACGWNAGRWRLTGDGTGGTCERTHDPADLSIHITALGASYLGGTPLGGLAGAGLVTELRDGAQAALNRALLWDPHPFCPFVF